MVDAGRRATCAATLTGPAQTFATPPRGQQLNPYFMKGGVLRGCLGPPVGRSRAAPTSSQE
eukprot:8753597-Alexandrium_andersonii.AAC.1